MAPVQWSDKIETKITVIDYEHRVLIDLLNQVEVLSQSDAVTHESKLAVFQELSDYVKTHFFMEEEMMRAFGYPGYAAHLAQHDEFRAKVLQLQNDLLQGDMAIMGFVSNFLNRWLVNHILKVDQELATFLIERKNAGQY
jgi:hemerythrin